MVRHTKRDHIWTATLELAGRGEAFSHAEVVAACSSEPPSGRTVRDVLQTMVDDGWLSTEIDPSDGSRRYVPSDRLTSLSTAAQ
ncbi:hypothetical protein [Haloarcula salinisoli]|uniref:Uncharacterized protein n=1 Tax=Haloarcula salinisoli TaxID=2487746 RepID=A0A8J7YFK0_9EURY|nr:hypothetical protein [Halomicroarcula salinisoli]MBX0286066.1 hypothetical protein [Halomicroarcula salinisoli]MBX0302446.1 hypothetical protein [Halomicroarcula salinisoli]